MAHTTEVARLMVEAAAELLTSLNDDQRAVMTWPFPADDERTLFFYTPTDHGGLPLLDMNGVQQRNTHRLVATGLSEAGYTTVAAIISLENVLDRVEGWRMDYGRGTGRARDPELYWVAIFGTPGDTAWGWRFGGHHVSLSYTVIEGRVVSGTPNFLGADPASSPLLGPHPHRPLAGAEDLGRELVQSLDVEQRRAAVVSAVAPVDLVGVNRTTLAEGDKPLDLPLIWRGKLEGQLLELMAGAQAGAVAALGLTEEHLDAVAFSAVPKGLTVGGMKSGQIEILRALLDVYVDRLPDEMAEAEKAAFAGSAIESLSFLWAGGIEVGEPHYYRVQGADLFVEYDNTQRDVNHVHTVWRNLRNDFARDSLAHHYAREH